MLIQKIISGGQTGADRAALDWALANGIEIGGYVPHGRSAEDGRLTERYANLIETVSGDPAERTELNVLHSDATMIVSHGDLAGGSKLSASLAALHKKPLLHVDLNALTVDEAADMANAWLASGEYKIMNVAGPRESDDAEIYKAVIELLTTVFAQSKKNEAS
jgi:hypothetical protein